MGEGIESDERESVGRWEHILLGRVDSLVGVPELCKECGGCGGGARGSVGLEGRKRPVA